jgi:hypothetical protein
MFYKWYMAEKKFKYRPKGGYPTSYLRRPYQYLVAMLCRLYWEPDTFQFSLFYMPLIYYYADKGISFNWDYILSENMIVTIFAVKGAQPGTFPIFHMSLYLLSSMCIAHKYHRMGWSWKPCNPTIYVYCKVLWEHKYHTKY